MPFSASRRVVSTGHRSWMADRTRPTVRFPAGHQSANEVCGDEPVPYAGRDSAAEAIDGPAHATHSPEVLHPHPVLRGRHDLGPCSC